MKSPLGKQQINIISFGSAQPQLTKKDISNYKINIPNKQEQFKLGEFYGNSDDLIFSYQQKLTHVQILKQSLLQKMFPKEGENIPEVRFPEFSGEWEKKNFADILKVNSGRDYKHLQVGNIPVYGTGGYMLSVNDKLSDKDAIGIGRKGTIDKPQFLKAPFWTVDTLFYLTVKEQTDLLFIFAMSHRINWKIYDESTGVPSLSKINIEKISISIPSLEEQILIGKIFKQIDNLITLHQRKLEHLQLQKKALLQQMFI